MRIDLKTLKHLKVQTVSGHELGHIADFELESEGQTIVQYKVKSSILRASVYLVGRGQVVAITAERMIVDDAVATAPVKNAAADGTPGVEPVAMRKIV